MLFRVKVSWMDCVDEIFVYGRHPTLDEAILAAEATNAEIALAALNAMRLTEKPLVLNQDVTVKDEGNQWYNVKLTQLVCVSL